MSICKIYGTKIIRKESDICKSEHLRSIKPSSELGRQNKRSKLSEGAGFSSTYNKIGIIQRRLAWPLCKDDMGIRKAFHILKKSWLRKGSIKQLLVLLPPFPPPTDVRGFRHKLGDGLLKVVDGELETESREERWPKLKYTQLMRESTWDHGRSIRWNTGQQEISRGKQNNKG